MCVYALEDIDQGSILKKELLGFAFPLIGIGAENIDNIIGREAKRFIKKGSPILEKDLQFWI